MSGSPGLMTATATAGASRAAASTNRAGDHERHVLVPVAAEGVEVVVLVADDDGVEVGQRLRPGDDPGTLVERTRASFGRVLALGVG